MGDTNPYAQYVKSPVVYQSPQVAPDVAHTGAQTQEITATLPSKVAEGTAKATTAQAEASQAPAQQAAKTQEGQANATKAQFQAAQEKIMLQRQQAQIRMFGDNINKTMDAVNQARQLIQSNPGQFDPVTYRIMQHVPGTAASKVAALIDPEHGPLASNQVLNTINTFRDEAGSNPGGGGTAPRVFRSEIPLFVNQTGALDPGKMGAAATLHTLDNMEYYGKRANATVNGANPDDPTAIKQYGIPSAPTMESAQAKLGGNTINPNTTQVLFNDEGKPGQLSPSQQADEQSYLKANPNTSPEAFNAHMSALTGRTVVNGKDILDRYRQDGGLNSAFTPNAQSVALANQKIKASDNGGAAAIMGGLSAIPFSNQIGSGIDTLTSKLTGHGSPDYNTNAEANRYYNDGLAARHPLPYYGGQLVGGTALLAGGAGAGGAILRTGKEGGALQAILDGFTNNPKTATSLGDLTYGAATNAGQNPDAPFTGAIEGAGAGGFGSALGTGFQKLGGKALSAAGQRLDALGIHVPIWPKLLPGGASRVADQNQQFNKEASNQAANFVGGDSQGVGAQGLTNLKSLGQDAYKDALDPVTGFPLTPEAQTTVSGSIDAANNMANPAARNHALRSLNQHVVGNLKDGAMTGEAFQGAYRGLSNDMGDISGLVNNSKISSTEGKALTNILGQSQDALIQSLQASHPEAFDKFLAANNLWRHMNVLGKATDAARNAVDGDGNAIFNSTQLSNASSANARSYNGTMASAQGDRPFNPLLNDMNYAGAKSGGSGWQSMLGHSIVPTLAFLAGGGAGEAEGGAEGAGVGALTLGALAAGGGSRAGQITLRALMRNAPNGFTAGAVPFTPNLNNWAPTGGGR